MHVSLSFAGYLICFHDRIVNIESVKVVYFIKPTESV